MKERIRMRGREIVFLIFLLLTNGATITASRAVSNTTISSWIVYFEGDEKQSSYVWYDRIFCQSRSCNIILILKIVYLFANLVK